MSATNDLDIYLRAVRSLLSRAKTEGQMLCVLSERVGTVFPVAMVLDTCCLALWFPKVDKMHEFNSRNGIICSFVALYSYFKEPKRRHRAGRRFTLFQLLFTLRHSFSHLTATLQTGCTPLTLFHSTPNAQKNAAPDPATQR